MSRNFKVISSIRGLFASMFTVFKHLFRKAVTLEYPEQKITPPDNFRGKPHIESCIKCMTCTKVCPSGAIKIEGNEFNIDLNKCIFCGNCAFYCPKHAINMGKEYELATDNKKELSLVYNIKEEGG